MIYYSLLSGALLIAGFGIHAHGETHISAPMLYSGMCDASAAVALTDKLFAVASDEAHNGSGRMDEWKRRRLLGVGADVLIPDFRDGAALLNLIFGA